MENIVSSLFADYLPRRQQEPMRVTDPRQQLIAPVVQRPTTAPTPRPTPAIPAPSVPRYVDSRDDFLPVRMPTVAPAPTRAPAPPIEPVSRYVDPRGAFTPAPYIAPTPTPAAPPTPPSDSRYVDPVGLFSSVPVATPTPTPVAPPTPPPVSRIVDPVSAFTPTSIPTTPPPAPVAPPAPPVAPVPRIVDPVSAFTPTPVPTPQPTPPTPVAPPAPPVEPVTRIVDPVSAFIPTPPTEEAPEFASVGGIGGGVVPTEEETTEPVAYGFGNFNSDALADINFDNIGLVDLSKFQGGAVADPFEGLSIKERLSVNQDAWVDVFNSYSDFLGSVESGNTTNKVNLRDDIYNNYFNENKAADRYLGDPANLRAAVGLSDAFSVYDKAGSTITGESLQGAYQALTSGANPVEALSAYYGFEIQPTSNEGANYTNAAKYGTDAQRMAEFQSLVEPILQKSIPYIQATQGLNYTDALEYAYTHDPMLNALYQSYGVDLYRQTKDGSTYIYDPIAGQEIRTLEVKDARFKDVFPSLLKAGVIALATGGIGAGLGGALGMTAGQTAALTGALGSLAQGGDPKDAILAAVTGGISGGLTDAVGSALGVSKDIATGITQAGLAAAQGAGSEEALLSGFLAGVGEYIRGEMPADVAIDPNTGAPVGTPVVDAVNPQGFVNTANTRAATDAVTTAISQNPAASLSEIIVTAQRINPNIAADVLTNVAQQIASGAVTPEGGMLTADTPAGDVEEVKVTADRILKDRATIDIQNGVIRFLTPDQREFALNPYGEYVAGIFQEQYGDEEWLKVVDAFKNGEISELRWRGGTLTADDLFGSQTSLTQFNNVITASLDQAYDNLFEGIEKPTLESDPEPQPELPETEEDMEIPEFDIENLPPDFNVDMPEDVIPPELPQPITVPTPTTGGGGGAAGGIPPVIPSVIPPSTPPPAGTDSSVEEVVDVFDDGGLTGDAFDDSTTGGAEGGAAEEGGAEGSEGAEGGADEVGGDAGDVDVTTTEQYKALQSELDNALASQGDLEIQVNNLQNEVAAANAAAQQAQEAADAAEAAGAANAEQLRGEAVAAQANADSLQGELAGVNEALGNANSTIDSLQGQLTGTQTALGNALATVETLTGNLNTAQATANNLSSQLSTAQSELSALESEYAQAVEANSSNVKSLEGKIEAKESEISELSSELSDATSTISELEGSLADAQAATEAAVAEGIANAEAAGKEGLDKGLGTGSGIGSGLGSAIGLLGGFGIGQAQGNTAVPYTRPEAEEFMAKLNFNLPEAERVQQQQLQDYVGMLLGNMR